MTLPASVLRELGCETRLAIENMECLLADGNDRLDLDDEHDPCRWVNGEYVDRAPRAPYRERDLDRHLPAGFPEQGHHLLDKTGVSLVEQSIELFAIPSEAQVNRGPKCRRRSFELTKLDVFDPAAVDPRDQRS